MSDRIGAVKEADVEELARRAVACKHWRWMPGMRIQNSISGPRGRVLANDPGYGTHPATAAWWGESASPSEGGGWQTGRLPLHSDIIPDLTDPATLGCLLALVREAWGTTAHTVRLQTNVCPPDGGDLEPACWWAVATGLQSQALLLTRNDGSRHYLAGPTEAAALVAALEAAP